MKILDQLKKEADRILQQTLTQKKVTKTKKEKKPTKIKRSSQNKVTFSSNDKTEESTNEVTSQIPRRQVLYRLITKENPRNPVKYMTIFLVNGNIISERNEVSQIMNLMLIKKHDTSIILPLPLS